MFRRSPPARPGGEAIQQLFAARWDTVQIELASEEPARLMSKKPPLATVADKKPGQPNVATVQHAPLKTDLRRQ